jgi:hypothetical protein
LMKKREEPKEKRLLLFSQVFLFTECLASHWFTADSILAFTLHTNSIQNSALIVQTNSDAAKDQSVVPFLPLHFLLHKISFLSTQKSVSRKIDRLMWRLINCFSKDSISCNTLDLLAEWVSWTKFRDVPSS